MIIYLATGEGWITPISKKERKQNKQNAGHKEVTSQGPARLSPRPYKMTASWDSAQSSPKATEQAAVGESNMTAEVGVAKQKQQEIERWTSDADPRKIEKEQDLIWQQIHSKSIKNQANVIDKAEDWKDEAALRYVYLPSTQRSYEGVNWDAKLAPKVLPPATTLERQPDPVSHRFSVNKRYESGAQPWQNLGRSFDMFQIRDGFHIKGPIELSYEGVNWDAKLAPKVLPPATTLERQPDPVSHRFSVNKRYESGAQPWQD
eukprot:XP_011682291.1 PREDICTED: uncharacterized protein LOC105446766 [Strongylocentrotus purpuratus]